MTESTEGWPKTNGLPWGEKTRMATSAPQRAPSWLAFLKRPFLRLENVTWRELVFCIFLISIFLRPMVLFCFVTVLLESSDISPAEKKMEGEKID